MILNLGANQFLRLTMARGTTVEVLDGRVWITEAGACSCGRPDCSSPGKHPLTKQGFKEASRDEAQIRGWWSKWPAANIGIPTGAVAGFDVLDMDTELGRRVLRFTQNLIRRTTP